jgi:anti-anti-sigma factor
MQLTTEQINSPASVTILALEGELDGSNFNDLIAKAKELFSAGTRLILLDLEKMSFMSSAGLVALHSIAMLLRGEQVPSPEEGWSAYHAIGRDRDSGAGREENFKLLNPQPKILSNLQKTGMDDLFEIYENRETALASFA